jgi:Fe2+ or Zn2+ uptake regulation protein
MAPSEPRGRRATRQRALVLDAVRASGVEHPTAERIFARVRGVLPRISLGTVYRNLQRLAAEGRIGVVYLDGRSARYDPTPERHDHFVCEECGRVVDLVATRPVAGLHAARRAGHVVRAHAVFLYGRCGACRLARPGGAVA